MTIKGVRVRRVMEKTILNFHFDYLNTSLIKLDANADMDQMRFNFWSNISDVTVALTFMSLGIVELSITSTLLRSET